MAKFGSQLGDLLVEALFGHELDVATGIPSGRLIRIREEAREEEMDQVAALADELAGLPPSSVRSAMTGLSPTIAYLGSSSDPLGFFTLSPHGGLRRSMIANCR